MELAVIMLFKTDIIRELVGGLEDLGLHNPTIIDSAGSAQSSPVLPFLRFRGLAGSGWRPSVMVVALAPTNAHWEQAAELAERLAGGTGGQDVIVLSIPVTFGRGIS